jgi:hypothetical protein
MKIAAPVAKYVAGTDPENKHKHCVWMGIGEDWSVIEYKASAEAARKSAEKWQKRENAAVAKGDAA